MAKLIKLEVVYALPNEQTLLAFSAPQDISIKEAIKISGILKQHPDIDLANQQVGIFSKRILNIDDHALEDGDRIEIYRPLQVDPKEARRRRAEKVMAGSNESIINKKE